MSTSYRTRFPVRPLPLFSLRLTRSTRKIVDIAALAEPLAVAWHAASVSSFKAGESALVIGAGPIGAAVVKVLKALGASSVYVSEPNETRRAIASDCGADETFDPLSTDVVKAVQEKSGGGVSVAIDCAGTQRTFDAAVEATQKRGRVVMVALWMPGNRPTIDMSVRFFPFFPCSPLRSFPSLLLLLLTPFHP
jgi:(R,R)-butanediol dehydrogenase/meso-butanediol dehydrogenase/diacetyl reductase